MQFTHKFSLISAILLGLKCIDSAPTGNDTSLDAKAEEASNCGKPFTDTEHSKCVLASFPNCSSFPGAPLIVMSGALIFEGKLWVGIAWNYPVTGFGSLWGYQVTLNGKVGSDLGKYQCVQVNQKQAKTKGTPLQYLFNEVKFSAQYVLSVQSMPANNDVANNKKEMTVNVGTKCSFAEWKDTAQCCSIVNASAVYKSGQMFVSWDVVCANKTLRGFKVTWTNIEDPENCHGSAIIQNRENTRILVPESCQRNNYSIKVFGKTDMNETTIQFAYINVPIPEIRAGSSTARPHTDSFPSDAAIAGGIASLILAISLMLFLYKQFFTPIYIRLDTPPEFINKPSSTCLGETWIEETVPLRTVLLVHTRCCDQCNRVVHCLGMMLNATGLLKARVDVWSEQEIRSGVVNWYEAEIRNASCVVVLASERMRTRDRNISHDNDSDDLLPISMQLNMIRGELAGDPDTAKFLPAYFTYNGQAKDIPDFLGSKMIYRLPKDLLRLVYHVLNIEKIRPSRFQSVTVIGGEKHPFEDAKRDLSQAVDEAALVHSYVNSNNVESEDLVIES